MGLQASIIPVALPQPALAVRSAHAGSNGFGPRDGYLPFTVDQSENSLAARFREAADRHAMSTAVVLADGRKITYGDLLERAAGIARGLSASVMGTQNGPLAILLPPGLEGIEAILGALLAGFPYLPMDPSTPDAQLERVLAAAEPAAILTDSYTAERLSAQGALRTIRILDVTALRTDRQPARLAEAAPGQVAVIFATSGTTGEPKLVGLSHRAILFDIGRQTNDLYLGPDDRFDLLFSLGFSASLAPLFGALLNGGQLHPLDLGAESVRLLNWLEEREITVSTMTTSTFRTAVATASDVKGRCPGLRLLSLGGESVGSREVAAFRATIADDCILQNAMASTETRTYAQYFVAGRSEAHDPLPIGWPVWGKEVLLLNENGEAIFGRGEGEVAIASRYLADGYINDPVRTKDRFVIQPDGRTLFRTGDRARRSDDGCLTFVGRGDLRVKVRGYRVEPEAVEAAIYGLPGVVECAVIARDEAQGEVALSAYYSSEAKSQNVDDEIRARLKAELPSYMQPSVLCRMKALPRAPNGKIDRQSLREQTVLREGKTSAATGAGDPPSLEAMKRLWAKVLGHSRFGAGDSFFHVGGDSLHAFRLLLLIEEEFGVRIAPNLFRQHNTLLQAAGMLEEQAYGQRLSPEAATRAQIVPLSAKGHKSPVFLVHPISGSVEMYYRLVALMGLDRPCYGIHAPAYTASDSQLTIEGIAAAYLKSARALLEVNGTAVFAGYSLGGAIAYEMARQHAESSGTAVPVLIIDCESGAARSRLRVAADVMRILPGWLRHVAGKIDSKALLLRGVNRFLRILGLGTGLPDAGMWSGAAGRNTLHARAKQLMMAALDRYVAQPYAGAVVLLRVRHPGLFSMRDPALGWSRLVPDLRVDVIPGWHEVCLSGENLAPSAEILRRHFDCFD